MASPGPMIDNDAASLLCAALQAWEQAGSSVEWCRDIGVDGRSLRFGRDIRWVDGGRGKEWVRFL